MHIYMARY